MLLKNIELNNTPKWSILIRNKLIIPFMASYLSACSIDNEPTNVTSITIGHEKIRTAVTQYLNESGQWYRWSDDNLLLIEAPLSEDLSRLITNKQEEIIPRSLSSAFNAEIHDDLIAQLNNRGINYRIVCFDEMTFIVLETESDKGIVQAIANQLMMKLIQEKGAVLLNSDDSKKCHPD